MDLSLAGRRALVCGGSRGIGRAAAHELALLGARVTCLARDAAKLREVVESLPRGGEGIAHGFIAADADDPAAVGRAVEGALADGPFHIFVHNTGGPPAGPVVDAGAEEFERAFRAHVLAGQALVRVLVPGMRDAGYGRIINIISTSVKAPIPGLGVSNTIRGAVASWAKTLSVELGPYGITVNNVLPGYTQTDRLDALVTGRAGKSGISPDEVRAELRGSIPARRFGTAEELGAAVAFLASPAAAYINGINLPVDGGRTPSL